MKGVVSLMNYILRKDIIGGKFELDHSLVRYRYDKSYTINLTPINISIPEINNYILLRLNSQ